MCWLLGSFYRVVPAVCCSCTCGCWSCVGCCSAVFQFCAWRFESVVCCSLLLCMVVSVAPVLCCYCSSCTGILVLLVLAGCSQNREEVVA